MAASKRAAIFLLGKALLPLIFSFKIIVFNGLIGFPPYAKKTSHLLLKKLT
jgi:hypothetical protein